MATHEDIKGRLEVLLPYFLTGVKLTRQPFYIVHTVHSYSRDFLGALVGLGLALPIATILDKPPAKQTWAEVMGLPSSYKVLAISSIFLVTFLKVYMTRANVEKRALSAKQCEQDLRAIYFELQETLEKENPTPSLVKIRNSVSAIRLKSVKDNSWTYTKGFAPGTDIEGASEAGRMCEKYKRWWKDVD